MIGVVDLFVGSSADCEAVLGEDTSDLGCQLLLIVAEAIEGVTIMPINSKGVRRFSLTRFWRFFHRSAHFMMLTK